MANLDCRHDVFIVLYDRSSLTVVQWLAGCRIKLYVLAVAAAEVILKMARAAWEIRSLLGML